MAGAGTRCSRPGFLYNEPPPWRKTLLVLIKIVEPFSTEKEADWQKRTGSGFQRHLGRLALKAHAQKVYREPFHRPEPGGDGVGFRPRSFHKRLLRPTPDQTDRALATAAFQPAYFACRFPSSMFGT